MKLLFDENLSHHLVARLATLFPGSAHVRDVGLERAGDQAIWAHARANGHAIVSKDEDFAERALLEGPPPKVVSIQLGNCTTAATSLAAFASMIDIFGITGSFGGVSRTARLNPRGP